MAMGLCIPEGLFLNRTSHPASLPGFWKLLRVRVAQMSPLVPRDGPNPEAGQGEAAGSPQTPRRPCLVKATQSLFAAQSWS